jgi:hypothetical protein
MLYTEVIVNYCETIIWKTQINRVGPLKAEAGAMHARTTGLRLRSHEDERRVL